MLICEHKATIEACRFCFMCRHVCTLGVVSGKESDTPRGKGLLLFKILKGYEEYSPDLVETVYRCCLCGLCEAWCKASCRPPEAVLAARADIVARGQEPAAVRKIRDNVLATGNPFGRGRGERFQGVDVGDAMGRQAEVLYYAGPDAACERPEIAAAFLKILRRAKVPFGMLADEGSTGKALEVLGYRDDARQAAEQLAGKIRAAGCRTVVTTCPNSWDALLKLDLPGVEVLHATQFVDRLVAQKRLALGTALEAAVTLLDGTYLGRRHGVYEEPRRVLAAIPKACLREMGWSREFAHGAGETGGVFRLLHAEESRLLAERVLDEAVQCGAGVLATTCPATKTALLAAGRPGMEIRDVMELVAAAV